MRASSRSSVTRSRPTTSRRPVRSRPGRRRAVAGRARRRAARLQLLRGPPRNHEVMVRGTFRTSACGTARRARGRLHPPPAVGRGGDDLRRRGALPGRGRAARRHRRPRVRLGQLPRLGCQGLGAPRRAGRDRRELRAHPPFQLVALGVVRSSSPRASRPRASGLTAPRRTPSAGWPSSTSARRSRSRWTAARARSRASPGSTRRPTSRSIATAACSRSSCTS